MPDTDELLTRMRARGPNLRSLGYRIRFDLTDSETSLLLDGTGGEPSIEESPADAAADTVLALSSDDLAKLIAGRLSPMLAFATGKLKVEGSKGVALKLASLLDED
ncbi:MAG: SCP2 sterol-binding domain-containing protein [Alphaproteobacteria bacterium]|nr:SCP2 sterol-binding domain-containing protein [Alphaproteobacteria bacterium]